MDMTEFLVEDENEIRQKEKIWDTMNHEYLEQQELKRLQLEEAHQVQTFAVCVVAVWTACHSMLRDLLCCSQKPCQRYQEG